MAQNKETAGSNPENTLKLQIVEQKLGELSTSMAVHGNEAAAAMTMVKTQHQQLTLQRLTAMVEAEHSYHRVVEILDELLAQMISERQRTEPAIPNSNPTPAFVAIPSYEKNVKPSNGHQTDEDATNATKATTVATKKNDWSKVRTDQLSTHTPPKFKLHT
jgi:hypothetical protein